MLGEAIRHALSGRPGPVLLSVPEDLLDQPAPEDARVDGGRPGPARASDEDIRAVIELLASARRPVILAGGGVLRARTSTDLLRFADLLQVPIVAAWRRADVVSNDHPLYLGMAGLGSASTVHPRLADADAMLVIGCRLNELTSHDYDLPRPTTRWAHVDLEPVARRGSRRGRPRRPGRCPGVPARRERTARRARRPRRRARQGPPGRQHGRSSCVGSREHGATAANGTDRACTRAGS